MVSITEKMANMQSTYDQNTRPNDVDLTNDSDSNFQDTNLQTEDSNFNFLEIPSNQYQSSQAIKDVIPNHGSYVNKNQIKPELLIDKAITNPESNVTQNHSQSRHILDDVISLVIKNLMSPTYKVNMYSYRIMIFQTQMTK